MKRILIFITLLLLMGCSKIDKEPPKTDENIEENNDGDKIIDDKKDEELDEKQETDKIEDKVQEILNK